EEFKYSEECEPVEPTQSLEEGLNQISLSLDEPEPKEDEDAAQGGRDRDHQSDLQYEFANKKNDMAKNRSKKSHIGRPAAATNWGAWEYNAGKRRYVTSRINRHGVEEFKYSEECEPVEPTQSLEEGLNQISLSLDEPEPEEDEDAAQGGRVSLGAASQVNYDRDYQSDLQYEFANKKKDMAKNRSKKSRTGRPAAATDWGAWEYDAGKRRYVTSRINRHGVKEFEYGGECDPVEPTQSLEEGVNRISLDIGISLSPDEPEPEGDEDSAQGGRSIQYR
ncbi:hypothetical protein V500_01555, partial [Pseudogymnoascus sp. VKM F-4518 (FW-2643)]